MAITGLPSVSGSLSSSTLQLVPGLTGTSNYNLNILGSAVSGLYNVPVKVVNRANNQLQAAGFIKLRVDNEAPSVPLGLSASLKGKNGVLLTFQASSDNIAVSQYQILRNGVIVGSTSSTSFTNFGISAVLMTFKS